MPQLNPEFFISQLFWLAVFFSFLLIFLWRVSLPRIATVLEKRQNKINEDLSTAKELQVDAQKIEKKINEQINKAKLETDIKIKKTMSTLQEEASSKLLTIDNELEAKILNAEKEIEKHRDSQMKNINNEMTNITKFAVSKVADLEISESVVNNAVKSANRGLN